MSRRSVGGALAVAADDSHELAAVVLAVAPGSAALAAWLVESRVSNSARYR